MNALLHQTSLEATAQRSLARLFLAFPVAAKQTVEKGTPAQQTATLAKANSLEKSGNLKEAAVEYRKAALLGESGYLPNCYNDWALQLRATIDREVLQACVKLTELNFSGERHCEAIEFARRALKLGPANESATGLLLESLITVGCPAEALREYQLFIKVLEGELGISNATSFKEVRRRAVAACQ